MTNQLMQLDCDMKTVQEFAEMNRLEWSIFSILAQHVAAGGSNEIIKS